MQPGSKIEYALPADSIESIAERADAYAAWVAQLRCGVSVSNLRPDGDGRLFRLGHELQALADVLSARDRELHRLFEMVETDGQDLSVEGVLDHAFERFRGLLRYDRISCTFLSEDGTSLIVHWSRSELGPVQISPGETASLAGSGLDCVLRTGRPMVLNDRDDRLKARPASDTLRRIVLDGGRSSLACPLVSERERVGLLFFTSRRRDAYRDTHQTMFRQIASLVSVVVDRNCRAQNAQPDSRASARKRSQVRAALVGKRTRDAQVRKLVDALIGARNRTFSQIMERNQKLLAQGENLTQMAERDALTGVLNRGAIMRAAELALTEAAIAKRPVGLIMADIDHFKRINDTLGHGAGDNALKEFTRRLADGVRQGDLLGRYGGEEFLIIASGPLSRDTLSKVAERLRQSINGAPIDLGRESRVITASFGGAIASGHEESAQDVIDAADRALYAAKNGGRNRVEIAEETGQEFDRETGSQIDQQTTQLKRQAN